MIAARDMAGDATARRALRLLARRAAFVAADIEGMTWFGMPKDPFIPREVHQTTPSREEARRGLLRALPEGSIPDRDRELAPSAIGQYRVHFEAAARTDRRRQSSGAEGEGKMKPAGVDFRWITLCTIGCRS